MEPKIIKPAIGRKVWYWPTDDDIKNEYMGLIDKSQAFDGSVVFAHDDREVNLFVVDHEGNYYDRLHVPLVQPGDTRPAEGGFCEWMPYQIEQAGK